jgi:eukaryotic-like serine/threonine-protein kinase
VADDERDTLVEPKKTRVGTGAPSAPSTRDPSRLIGHVLAGYLVEEHLGSGAMGAVYRAKHLDTHRVVALKVLHDDYRDRPKAVARFRREATMASRLGHPHIATVVEMIEDHELGIAFDLVDGEPLTQLLTMPMPPERVLTIIGQLLRALEHAHAMSVIHRDLKPDNILVEWRNERDHARIVDFGVATLSGPDADLERITGTGEVLGTPLYMSPEQARGDTVDHRADLYALGMIMYEMLAGSIPFYGRAIEVLDAKLKRDPPPFSVHVPDVLIDPLHERFCRKFLARRPDERFQTARQALDVLKLLQQDPAAAGPALGVMDVAKALAVVSLPMPRKLR